MKTLAIIGGGASGMLAGITALETNPDIQVIIFDQKDILGKKILSTGNGRCNLTNKNMSLDYFRSDEPQLISSVLKAFGYSDTIRFFENLGLLMKSRNGYIYPRCDQASVVRSVLDNRLIELGADIRRENAVTSICRTKKGFQIETGSEKFKLTASFYQLAEKLLRNSALMAAVIVLPNHWGILLCRLFRHWCS